MERWAELLVGVARARVFKRKAVADEDFAEASRLKKEEAACVAELTAAREAAIAEAGAGGGADTSEERRQLEEAKKRAVAEEDFAEAGRLKKRIKLLDEGGGGGGAAADPAEVERAADAAAQELAAADPEHAAAILAELQKEAGASGAAAAAAAGARAPRAVASSSAAQLRQKEADIQRRRQEASTQRVKNEAPPSCPLPGVSVEQFVEMSNQDIWQKAWEITWQVEEAAGKADDQKYVYAQAQKVWKQWLADRDRMVKEQTEAVEAAAPRGVKREAGGQPVQRHETGCPEDGDLGADQLKAQEEQWKGDRGAQADWQRATAEAERKRKAREGEDIKSSRDLCALVKLRSPSDQPVQFERLLAVCPVKTTVRQLIQAMAKEPQEFKQNYDGSEFCVRPVNSRAADWLPVQASTTPPGFRDDACLPESMLNVAKTIFEERLKPQAQAAEDPLGQFLSQPGRIPPDTAMPFADLLKRCPPGTKPMDVIRTMSKRRDVFRQDASGLLFCVRPRAKCKDWAAVNPYVDPATLLAPPPAHVLRAANLGGGSVAAPVASGGECEPEE